MVVMAIVLRLLLRLEWEDDIMFSQLSQDHIIVIPLIVGHLVETLYLCLNMDYKKIA